MKKIVIITYASYLKEARTYSLETLDYIASIGDIIDIEIIEFKTIAVKKKKPIKFNREMRKQASAMHTERVINKTTENNNET